MLPTRVTDLVDHPVDDIETRYEFLDELGEGTSSVVYLARRRTPTPSSLGAASSPPSVVDCSREVAIKVFDTEALADEDVFEAVQTEVEVLRRAKHPYIVGLVEVICDASSFAVVTEALTGGDLHARLAEEGALTEDGAREVLARVVLAVEHLHLIGIVHRDLKAENLVALSMDAEFEDAYKLVDFGSAFQQPASSGHGSPMRMAGLFATAAYCAPEVARSAGYGDVQGTGAAYGAEVDLWSLGVLLFVMLSRRLPFDAAPVGHGPAAEDDEHGEDRGEEDEDEMAAEAREAQLLARVASGCFDFAPVAAWRSVSADAKDLIRRLLTLEPSRRLSWDGVRRHPWCAPAIAACEAALALEPSALGTPPRSPSEGRVATRSPLSREGSVGVVAAVPDSEAPLSEGTKERPESSRRRRSSASSSSLAIEAAATAAAAATTAAAPEPRAEPAVAPLDEEAVRLAREMLREHAVHARLLRQASNASELIAEAAAQRLAAEEAQEATDADADADADMEEPGTPSRGSSRGRATRDAAEAWAERLAAHVFARLDADGSGTISIKELLTMMHGGSTAGSSTVRGSSTGGTGSSHATTDRQAVLLFDRLDCDRDGQISQPELRAGMVEAGTGHPGMVKLLSVVQLAVDGPEPTPAPAPADVEVSGAAAAARASEAVEAAPPEGGSVSFQTSKEQCEDTYEASSPVIKVKQKTDLLASMRMEQAPGASEPVILNMSSPSAPRTTAVVENPPLAEHRSSSARASAAPAPAPATWTSEKTVIVGGCSMAKDWSERAGNRRGAAAATAAGRLQAILERRRVAALLGVESPKSRAAKTPPCSPPLNHNWVPL